MKRTIFYMILFLLVHLDVEGRQVEFSILHTTDLQGHILPLSDGGGGGLLRCAGVIRSIREEVPNVLLVDCGNAFVGSIESHLTNGDVMLKALEELDYDAWGVGGHDWDLGGQAFRDLQDRSRASVLACNMRTRPGRPDMIPKVKPFLFKQVDGVSVAIVGLSESDIPLTHRPEMLGDLLFEDSIKALQRIMPAVRQREPDIMILAVHQRLLMYDDLGNQLNEIARLFPEFEIILGRRTGRTKESRRLGHALYSEAGNCGQTLGRVDVVYDTVRSCVTDKKARIYEVNDSYGEDEKLRLCLKRELQNAVAFGNKLVGSTETEKAPVSNIPGQSSVQNVICKAITEAVNADIALHAVSSRGVLQQGDIYMRDIWRIVPHAGCLGIAELTVSEVESILEENARHVDSSVFMGIAGVRYDLDKHGPKGKRVSNISLPDGTVPHPRKRFKVAMDSYFMASAGGRFPKLRQTVERPLSRLRLTAIDTRQAVVNYIRKNSPLP